MECILIVIVEMVTAVLGIFINLMVFSSVRKVGQLQRKFSNLLLSNICLSNILVAFLVKPISAVFLSYSISTGKDEVDLAFCTLYTFTYRTTWLVFPFSLTCLCWNSLDTLCVYKESGINQNSQPEGFTERDRTINRKKHTQLSPSLRQKALLVLIWLISILFGIMSCFPEKVINCVIL